MLGALFGFKGRLSRPGFWEVLISILLVDISLLLGRMYLQDSGLPGGQGPQSPLSTSFATALPWLMVVFTAWGLLAAAVKRCHDRGRSGALLLLALIPVIGWLWLAVDLFLLGGNRGRNRYGRLPNGHEAGDAKTIEWGAPAEPPAPVVYEGADDMHADEPLRMQAPPPAGPPPAPPLEPAPSAEPQAPEPAVRAAPVQELEASAEPEVEPEPATIQADPEAEVALAEDSGAEAAAASAPVEAAAEEQAADPEAGVPEPALEIVPEHELSGGGSHEAEAVAARPLTLHAD